MKMGAFLLEMLLVLAIIFCLYYMIFNKSHSAIVNEDGNLIVEDVKSIVEETTKIANNPEGDNKEAKENVEKRINKLMKKYNVKK